jgi:hypothetical protein
MENSLANCAFLQLPSHEKIDAWCNRELAQEYQQNYLIQCILCSLKLSSHKNKHLQTPKKRNDEIKKLENLIP